MKVCLLKSKIHRAKVTDANLNYEGSITISRGLMKEAKILPYEKVEIYNLTRGTRLATYVIPGDSQEITINGAAAHLVRPGDKVIICAYTWMEEKEAKNHQPTIILLDENNEIQKP